MNEEQIRTLLTELGQRLAAAGLHGEMLIVGGTAMAFNSRRQTKDIDAIFEPKARIYEIAAEMADERGLPVGWLSDAAKGFFPQHDSGQRTILNLPDAIRPWP